MYSNSLSFLVGSAQEKLANDIRYNNKLAAERAYYESAKNSKSSMDKLDETLNLGYVKWSIRISLFLIFGTLFSFSIYKVVLYQKTCCDANTTNLTNFRSRFYYGRYPSSYQHNTPVIYEINPVTFFDSDNDGIGDINGIAAKLDYIQKSLMVNCILIKNIQHSYSFKYYDMQLTKTDAMDDKIGTIEDLINLVAEARKRSIKVLLEIQVAHTSIEHHWFTGEDELDVNYMTSNTKPDNVDEIKKWSYSPKYNIYYFSNGIETNAYLNYDNEQVQKNILNSLDFWLNVKLSDGLYIKDFNRIQYRNRTLYDSFISGFKSLVSNSPIRLMTDYEGNTHESDEIFDTYRVDLEVNRVLLRLTSNADPFEELNLTTKHSLVWSFKPFDMPPYQYEQRRYIMTAMYSLVYSLVGSVVLRQGDELEYTNHANLPQVFRWSDLEPHSGFSLTAQLNLWWFPVRVNRIPVIEDGYDLQYVNENRLSLVNFLRLLNSHVKYRLINDQPLLNATNSVFYVNRNTVNIKKSCLFLLNFSRYELQLSQYISDYDRGRRLRVNTMYDSTNVLGFNQEIKNATAYHVKPNSYLILELELI